MSGFRLHALTMDGVSAHDAYVSGPVTIDADGIGDGLVALVGGNGVGKTHLLEAIAAALYNVWPSYGVPFAAHVKPAHGLITVDFAFGGHRYVLRRQADPRLEKHEAYLTRDGEPIAGPNVKAVAKALAEIGVPSRDLFLASVFKSQEGVKSKSGSLFARDPADRRKIVAEMLRLGDIQTLADRAAAEAKAAHQAVVQANQTKRDAEEAAAQAAAFDAEIERCGRDLMALEEVLERDHARAQAASLAHATAVEALRALREQLARRQELAERLGVAERDLGVIQRRREKRAPLLAETLVDNPDGQLPTAEEHLARVRAEEAAQVADEQRLATEIATLTERLTELRRRADEANDAVKDAKAHAERVGKVFIPAAADTVADGIAGCEAVHGLLAERVEWLARLADEEMAASTGIIRIMSEMDLLRPRLTALAIIPGVPECESCPLTVGARADRDRFADLNRQLVAAAEDGYWWHGPMPNFLALQDAKIARERSVAVIAAWRRVVDELRKLELQVAGSRAHAADLPAREAKFDAIVAEGKDTRAQLDARTAEQQNVRSGLAECRERVKGAEDNVTALRAQSEKAQRRADAAADEAVDLEAEREKQAEVDALTAALAALPDPDADTDPASEVGAVEVAVTAVATAETEQVKAVRQRDESIRWRDEARDMLTRRQAQREAFGADPAGVLAQATAALATAQVALVDWSLLEQAFGPTGIQAMEMAGAGPSITALANDLLTLPFDGRFQMALVTTEPKKDGRGDKDVFEFRILDTLSGGPIDQGCGGQMAFLDEAARLAAALFWSEQSNVACEELWRDEPSAAFDPVQAKAYVTMLRRACERGHFRRCWFISHHESVWSQADRVLWLNKGGRLTLDAPEVSRE